MLAAQAAVAIQAQMAPLDGRPDSRCLARQVMAAHLAVLLQQMAVAAAVAAIVFTVLAGTVEPTPLVLLLLGMALVVAVALRGLLAALEMMAERALLAQAVTLLLRSLCNHETLGYFENCGDNASC